MTDQREAENQWADRQRLLMNELAHRVTNTLSVVQEIVNQTLRSAKVETGASNRLMDRLKAIAKAQDLLVQQDWKGANFADIVRDQLSAYLSLDPAPVTLEGPPVMLPRETGTSVSLLVHELAANAAKHGALSVPAGRLALTWTLVESSGGKTLKVHWEESAGPRVKAPTKSGFGMHLIDKVMRNTKAVRDFRPEGLVCTLEIAVSGPASAEPDRR